MDPATKLVLLGLYPIRWPAHFKRWNGTILETALFNKEDDGFKSVTGTVKISENGDSFAYEGRYIYENASQMIKDRWDVD